MKKLNNKGFAITGIIYGLMLLFVLIISSFLSILIGRNRRMDELVLGIYETLEYPSFNVVYDSNTNIFTVDGTASENEGVFVTKQRGKYTIGSCTMYLPKNVVVISEKMKNPDSTLNKFYYKADGGQEVEEYTELCS